MKFFLLFVCAFCFVQAHGQAQKKDISKAFASVDRKEILEALKLELQPGLKLKPKMVVKKLVMKSGFAYFVGQAKAKNGGKIDFTKTAYREAVEQGVFDGDGTNALLKKSKGAWKVLAYAIGPTDVPWGCWWKEFKAPKEIFDYTVPHCD